MSNIEIVRKRLGPVTAYKYAVSKGFTGTEEEFAELMASYATVAEEAEAAKDDAIIAKTAAEEAQAAAEAAAEQAEGAIEVDDTLSVNGRAADAKAVGDKISDLKEKTNDIQKYFYEADESLTATITTTGYKIVSTGYSSADASYNLLKYPVTSGEVIKFVSDGYCQFQSSQSSPSSPSSGILTRIGETYSSGTHYEIVPDGATYLVLSLLVENGTAAAYTVEPILPKIQSAFDIGDIEFTSGYYINYLTGAIVEAAGYKYTKLPVNIFAGGNIKGVTSVAPNTNHGIAFYDKDDIYISGSHSTNTDSYKYAYDLTVPNNAVFMRITLRIATEYQWKDPEYPWDAVFKNLHILFKTVDDKVDKVQGKGLSSNDYTTVEKNKLAGIATGATKVQFTDSNSDGNIVISFG